MKGLLSLVLLFPLMATAAPVEVEKVNDSLFISRRAPDQTFVMKAMETEAELQTWMSFGEEEHGRAELAWRLANSEKLTYINSGYDYEDPEVRDLDRVMAIRDAPGVFSSPLTPNHLDLDYAGLGTKGPGSRFWVSFFYSHKDQEFDPSLVTTTSLDSPLFNGIEILMSVMTHPEAHFSHHMGIWRTIRYSAKVEDYEADRHPKLAMELHRFAAAVTRVQHPQAELVVTSPTGAMANLMKKTMPEGTLYEDIIPSIEYLKFKVQAGPTPASAREYLRTAQDYMICPVHGIDREQPTMDTPEGSGAKLAMIYTSPKDGKRHVVDNAAMASYYHAFLTHPQLGITTFHPMVGIDLEALASLTLTQAPTLTVEELKNWEEMDDSEEEGYEEHPDPLVRSGILYILRDHERAEKARARVRARLAAASEEA